MPEIVEVLTYRFDELDDDAKSRARDWCRETEPHDGWWETVYEDFEQVCDLIGVCLKTSTVNLLGGGTRQKTKIYFSGFWSQGDGACFGAHYRYRKGAASAVRRFAPDDVRLHQIVDDLAAIQRRNFYQLRAETSHSGRYYHQYCMGVDVRRDDGEMTADAEDAVKEALRDLALWLIDEAILINRYTFFETGAFYA